MGDLTIRLATENDLETLTGLMHQAIAKLLKPYMNDEVVDASFEVMGLDTQLVADRTYYAVECDGVIGGCGGWSRRKTLFGGDHSEGRDAEILDPERDAARIRAMYTHPDFTRRGIGRLVLDTCEAAAAAEGFRKTILSATLSGEPLYRACGYQEIERTQSRTSTGVSVPLVLMGKTLSQ